MGELNQTFNKGLQVVELLQLHQQLSLVELVALTEMSKQSLLRCLETLVVRGWVRKRVNDWRYVWIGIASSSLIKQHEIWAKQIMPYIQKIPLKEGMACDLALLNEAAVLTLVDSTRSRGSEGVNGYVAGYQPSLVMTALGRAYLFACSKKEFDKKFSQISHQGDLAERNFINQTRWLQEKQRIEKQGFSLREVNDHLSQLITESLPSQAIAVPIIASKNSEHRIGNQSAANAIGAINLVWQAQKYTFEEVKQEYLDILRVIAKDIAVLIQY